MVGDKIKTIKSRWILDSRGNPTVEVDVTLRSGTIGRTSVPSGASTGSKEALELRDGGLQFNGKGVQKALSNIDKIIGPELIGKSASKQKDIDDNMLNLDGTKNKSRLGANATLAVSLAIAKAYANNKNIPFYKYISSLANVKKNELPVPMANLFNGGRHANFASDFQEYMVFPLGIPGYKKQLQAISEIFTQAKSLLVEKGFSTTVGDEGGFAPKLPGGNTAPIDMLQKAIVKAGYKPGREVSIAIDVAASEFYKDGIYHLKADEKLLSRKEMLKLYADIIKKYPVISIEDGFFESDFEGWEDFVKSCSDKITIVGDDLLVTNPSIIRNNIAHHRATGLLVKPNQIGTLSETLEAVRLAKDAGWKTVMSHRSGETEDTSIAHLAVGLGTDYIKTGSVSRSERTAKYNELLRISEELNS